MTNAHEQQIPFDVPPDLLIRKFAADFILEDQVSLEILEIGCGMGRNTRFLSKLGHIAFGVDNDPTQLKAAESLAVAAGVEERSVYSEADARNLPDFGRQFDAVIICEVLQQLPKVQSTTLLQKSGALVKPGGFHVVSGYVADSTVRNPISRERYFSPGELMAAYTSNQWRITYSNAIRDPNQYIKGKEHVSSRDQVIAQKLK